MTTVCCVDFGGNHGQKRGVVDPFPEEREEKGKGSATPGYLAGRCIIIIGTPLVHLIANIE